MNIFISIDDTDNLESPGSGELADSLRQELQESGLTGWSSSVARHQLCDSEAIACTSHNSAMCFQATVVGHSLDDAIHYSQEFLRKRSAPGSDPGLCVAVDSDALQRDSIIDYGFRAKRSVVAKSSAYNLARQTGVHLSEHGGTGDGIIGALAALGLYLSGNDGRIRGWLELGERRQKILVKDLLSREEIDGVVDLRGDRLADDASVMLAGNRTKTVRSGHLQMLPVVWDDTGGNWKTLTKAEVKCF